MKRFFTSIKDEEAWTTEYDTRVDAIDAWIADCSTQRPHHALDYLTPAEYRATAQLGPTCATQAA